MRTKNIATTLAILAAALYAINVPISKLLMEHIGATMMAGLLYFGAGTGMLIYVGITKAVGKVSKKACICWGFENNCTKMISNKSSEEIVIIKGVFSGLGSLIVALFIGKSIPSFIWILAAIAFYIADEDDKHVS